MGIRSSTTCKCASEICGFSRQVCAEPVVLLSNFENIFSFEILSDSCLTTDVSISSYIYYYQAMET